MKRKIVTDITELRKKSKTATYEEVYNIIKDLEDTLDTSKGIGLSAIQIGIPKAVGIIRYGEIKIDLINPITIQKNDKFRMKSEGCLSIPGIFIDTLRYKEIVIINNNRNFSFDLETDNILPVAILHEIDHMNGRLILDAKWRKR